MKKQLRYLFASLIMVLFSIFMVNAQTPPISGSWVKIPELTNEFDDEINSNFWDVKDPKWDGRWPSYFEAANVSVADGELELKCRPVNPATDIPPYHSKGTYTLATAAFKSTNKVLYGYFEVEAKAVGGNYWNSFWLYDYTKDQHTELDIFEIVASKDYYFTTAHRFYDLPDYIGSKYDENLPHYKKQKEFGPWAPIGVNFYDFFKKGFFTEYHKYGLDWNKDYIAWYVDDKEVFRTENDYWHQELYLIVDAEVSTWPETLPSTEEVYKIKYIRAWKNDASDVDEDLNISSVYPNPGSDEFNLSFSSSYIGEVAINVFTIDGREVKKYNLQKTKTKFIHQINLPNQGIYFIQFVAGNYRSTHKIININKLDKK